jgi:sensor histidine kinase regulating citrate/malate metabolism
MSNVYDALMKAERSTETTRPLSLSWRAISLEWKIMILVFGILFVAVVSHLMGRALRTQIDERSAIIAANLSDAASGYLVSRDVLPLKIIVTKYGRLNGVAYALIEDRDGKVIANSLASSSPESQQALSSDQRRQAGQQLLTLQGKTVYDTREPILEGQLGTAHIGMWANSVEREIYQTLLFLWPVALSLLLAVVGAVLLARRVIPQLRRLIDIPNPIGASEFYTLISSRFGFERFGHYLKRMQGKLTATLPVSRDTASAVKDKGERNELGGS